MATESDAPISRISYTRNKAANRSTASRAYIETGTARGMEEFVDRTDAVFTSASETLPGNAAISKIAASSRPISGTSQVVVVRYGYDDNFEQDPLADTIILDENLSFIDEWTFFDESGDPLISGPEELQEYGEGTVNVPFYGTVSFPTLETKYKWTINSRRKRIGVGGVTFTVQGTQYDIGDVVPYVGKLNGNDNALSVSEFDALTLRFDGATSRTRKTGTVTERQRSYFYSWRSDGWYTSELPAGTYNWQPASGGAWYCITEGTAQPVVSQNDFRNPMAGTVTFLDSPVLGAFFS